MSLTYPDVQTRRSANIEKLERRQDGFSAINIVVVIDIEHEEAEDIKQVVTKLNSYLKLQEFCTMEITKEIYALKSIREKHHGIITGLDQMLEENKLAKTLENVYQKIGSA
jgi:hypothetical protein